MQLYTAPVKLWRWITHLGWNYVVRRNAISMINMKYKKHYFNVKHEVQERNISRKKYAYHLHQMKESEAKGLEMHGKLTLL